MYLYTCKLAIFYFTVSTFLIDIHVRLLRRVGKGSVTNDRWEKYVIKVINQIIK